METLLVHKEIADAFMPAMVKAYQKAHVTMIGDDRALAYEKGMIPATDEDWATEYNDLRLSIRIVDSMQEAVAHIRRYGTGHSAAIVTADYETARRFQQVVDAACVRECIDTVYGRVPIRVWRGNRHQYAETPCPRPYGPAGADDNQIPDLWKWTDPFVTESFTILHDFFMKDCYHKPSMWSGEQDLFPAGRSLGPRVPSAYSK